MEYGASAESSRSASVILVLVLSTMMLSPLAGSLCPGWASSVSTFTARTGGALKGAVSAANVVVESISCGSSYSATARSCVAVSRCGIVRKRYSESTPITAPVVVSLPIRVRVPIGGVRKIGWLPRTPGTVSARR